MSDTNIIDLTPDNIAEYGVCGYKDIEKHKELRKKIEWFNQYYSKGLRIKVLFSQTGGYQGMLEYLPGKYAHRPVVADGYMFIQCIFVGFKKEFKQKGYASLLINECIKAAKRDKMLGLAVVTRSGPFMVGKDLFLKQNFKIVDTANPDFSLLALKFASKNKDPKFNSNMTNNLKKYSKGLTILRSPQCPYTEKNVNAIIDTAQSKYKLKVKLVDLEDHKATQSVPCAFGTFAIIYEGKVISHHPISSTRFENIMKNS